MEFFNTYAVGFCASVCTDMDVNTATERLNAVHPTGVGSWKLSDDKTFKGGEPMPCECPNGANRKHYLFEC